MAEPKGFSHITVTPDEDEDVVIQAGVVEGADEADDADEFDDADDAGEFDATDELNGEEVEFAEDEAEELDDGPDDESADEPSAPAAASVDDYHETTLDDLASSKMSTTQKAVILVAVLGIIAFAVWYVLAQ